MPRRTHFLRSAVMPALLLALVLAACGAQDPDLSDLVEPLTPPDGQEDLSDLVEPLTPDDEDLADMIDALEAPGHGTITISRERRGTYTSRRDYPVDVEFSEEATITFVLDTEDGESFDTVDGAATWSYSLLSTETGDGCTVIEQAEGSGIFETGPNGPYLQLGIDEDYNIDSNAYTLIAAASPEETTDGDPNTHYNVSSTFCAEELPLAAEGLDWWPYFADGGTVSGTLTPGSTTIWGSHQETRPALAEGPPTTVTVTWALRLP